MNREIRTDLAIELRENVADRRNMPGVKVKTVVNEEREHQDHHHNGAG